MKWTYVVIGSIWFCSFAGAMHLFTPAKPSVIESTSAEVTRHSGPAGTPAAPHVENHGISAPPMDLLGNEVEHAVADYRFDRGGAVYERHSPETAIPQLGSPSS